MKLKGCSSLLLSSFPPPPSLFVSSVFSSPFPLYHLLSSLGSPSLISFPTPLYYFPLHCLLFLSPPLILLLLSFFPFFNYFSHLFCIYINIPPPLPLILSFFYLLQPLFFQPPVFSFIFCLIFPLFSSPLNYVLLFTYFWLPLSWLLFFSLSILSFCFLLLFCPHLYCSFFFYFPLFALSVLRIFFLILLFCSSFYASCPFLSRTTTICCTICLSCLCVVWGCVLMRLY